MLTVLDCHGSHRVEVLLRVDWLVRFSRPLSEKSVFISPELTPLSITVVAVIMYFYYPETKGLILEEISRIFDGPQTGKDIIAASGPSADTDEAKEKEEAAAGRLDDNIAQLHFQSSNQEV